MDALEELRERVREVDDRLLPLFLERMEIVEEIAEIKQANGIPVLDREQEQRVLARMLSGVAAEHQAPVSVLMRAIFALSKARQREVLTPSEGPLLPPPREPVTENVVCVCHGAPGTWGEHALTRVLPAAGRRGVERVEDVFLAVRAGEADYGVVSLKDFQTGAIEEVYDLPQRHGCYIVGRTTLDAADFIIIAREPEYDAGCNRVSVVFSPSGHGDAFWESLLPFLFHGIRPAWMESCPSAVGGRRVFMELEGSILDKSMRSALERAAMACEHFRVVGCYHSQRLEPV